MDLWISAAGGENIQPRFSEIQKSRRLTCENPFLTANLTNLANCCRQRNSRRITLIARRPPNSSNWLAIKGRATIRLIRKIRR